MRRYSQNTVILVNDEAVIKQTRQQFEYSNTHQQANLNTKKRNQTVSDILCVDSQNTVTLTNHKSLDGAKNQPLAEISSQLQDYRNKQRNNYNLLNRPPLLHSRKKINTAEEPGANKPNVRMSRSYQTTGTKGRKQWNQKLSARVIVDHAIGSTNQYRNQNPHSHFRSHPTNHHPPLRPRNQTQSLDWKKYLAYVSQITKDQMY